MGSNEPIEPTITRALLHMCSSKKLKHCRGVGTYTDARTGPDKVLGKLYHKSSQGQSNLTKM